MVVVYMAAVVTILSTATGAQDVRVVPNGVKTQQECNEWKAEMELTTVPVSDKTGRAILGRYVQCIPVQSEFILEDIQLASSKSAH